MSVLESLKSRKSVREYLDKPVDRHILDKIFEAARYTPSSKNTQPWKIVVLSGDKKQKLMTKLIAAFELGIKPELEYEYDASADMPDDLKQRAIQCGKDMFKALDIARDDKQKRLAQWKKNYTSFNSPVAVFIFTYPETAASAYIDCGAVSQSIMLAANELGVATCPQASLAQYPDIVKNELNMQDYKLLFGLAMGYEDSSADINNYRTARDPVENIVSYIE